MPTQCARHSAPLIIGNPRCNLAVPRKINNFVCNLYLDTQNMNRLLTIIGSITILCAISSCSADSGSEETSEVLLRIKIGDKYGFINDKGDIVIEPQFDNAFYYFSDGVCFAKYDGTTGLIDNNGHLIVELPDSISWVYSFTKGKGIVLFENGEMNIVRTDGNYVLENDYKYITQNEDGESLYYILHRKDNKWLAADSTGNVIGEPCDSILSYSQNLCPVKHKDKWGYMDPSGNITIDTIYKFAWSFSQDGIARVKKDSIESYINETGKTLFSADKAMTPFACNRAAVKIDNRLYLLNKTGNKICEINADDIYGFHHDDGLATIIRNGKAIKIDSLGREILSTKYENIGAFVNGIAPVIKNEKIGFINKEGKEIIPLDFDDFSLIFPKEDRTYSIIWVKNSDGTRFYDNNGNLIGKDMGLPVVTIPSNPTKDDFIKYFDANLSKLAPLEGIYYVTAKAYYEDRDDTSRFGLNNSKSRFFAIVKNHSSEEYLVYFADGSNKWWINKFVRIGESDNYAILKIDKDSNYSSEGSMTIENPNAFGFRLEQGHNSDYNFFVTYDFVRDYPYSSEIEKFQQAEWTGTGFAIADGYIATNYHVTSGAKEIRIRGINGDIDTSYKAAVVAFDKEHDLSIIRIVDKRFKSLGNIPYSIGKSTVDVGEDVFVLGYPMVSSMGTEIKLTEGTISSSSGYHGNNTMFQISAAVQPGNSGGPLFNERGIVIGVVCGKHTNAENANYAIKISYLYSLINSSKLDIELPPYKVWETKLSKKVKTFKDFVYLIECNTK